MGGTRRAPRFRGGGPVLPYPIDRHLRLCARVGPQHFFVVVRHASSFVVRGVWRSRRRCYFPPTGGGAGRAGAARAARSAARVRVLLSCGCGCCSGGACVAALAVPGMRAVRSACVAAAACARALGAKKKEGGGRSACFCCKQGVALRRERRACGPPVPVRRMLLMSLQAVAAVAAAESPGDGDGRIILEERCY